MGVMFRCPACSKVWEIRPQELFYQDVEGHRIYETWCDCLDDRPRLVKCKACSSCAGSGRTDNHVTGEVECSHCEGSGLEPNESVSYRVFLDAVAYDIKSTLPTIAVGQLLPQLGEDGSRQLFMKNVEGARIYLSHASAVDLRNEPWLYVDLPAQMQPR